MATFLKRRPPPKQEATSAASPVSEFHKFGDTVLQHVMARIFVASQSLVFTVQGFSGAHFLTIVQGPSYSSKLVQVGVAKLALRHIVAQRNYAPDSSR